MKLVSIAQYRHKGSTLAESYDHFATVTTRGDLCHAEPLGKLRQKGVEPFRSIRGDAYLRPVGVWDVGVLNQLHVSGREPGEMFRSRSSRRLRFPYLRYFSRQRQSLTTRRV